MGRPLPLTTLLVLAVFVATGGIIWLAYGDTGNVQGEPPLIKASVTPLKKAPDDPGGREVAELGGVGELLIDQPEDASDETLMPAPEQPLSPAEAAIASLGQGDTIEELAPSPEKRDQATAALQELVDGLRAGGAAAPGGVGGPVSATTEWRPSPRRPGELGAPRTIGTASQPTVLQPNEPERRRNTDFVDYASRQPAGVQVAAIGDVVPTEEGRRFQGTPGGRFRVQLAAVREENDAERAWSLFQDQLGPYVGGLQPFFEQAETNNGTFYRVQIGPFADSGDAASLCVELKKQNASCFVVSR